MTSEACASPAPWRLVMDPPADGAFNMAADELMLQIVGQRQTTIVRFYRWCAPTLSLGRSQKIDEAADREFCRRHQIEIVRRPTGGQAVLHDREITYSFASSDPGVLADPSPYGAYRRVSGAIARGIASMGIPVELAPRMRRSAARRADPCFLEAGMSEVLSNGRKLCGSAQRRFHDRFLQHGSILVGFDPHLLAGCTRADAAVLQAGVTSVGAELQPSPSTKIEEHLVDGIRSEFGIEFHPAPWTEAERALIEAIADRKYRMDRWNVGAEEPEEVDSSADETELLGPREALP
ncbi:MAG: lipoate--protein ligase family protein [Acidobacteria bacterium]|nr:lipoate--protein ligase family protein [Acidobacteriota bacterium]